MEKGILIGAGRTADVYAWGDEHILKLYQERMPVAPIEREFTITRLAKQAGLAVPVVIDLVKIDGRVGIIFERIRGTSLLKVLERHPWKLISIARLLAEIHARMHSSSLPVETYSQRAQIEQGISWAKGLSESEKETIQAVLANLPAENAVCHGDFHPDNIILTSHGPVIIDWLTGTRGHPLADVGRTILILQTSAIPPSLPGLTPLLINASRGLLVSVYRNRYLQLHPASRSEIDAWQLPLHAARLFEVEGYPREKRIILERIRSELVKWNAINQQKVSEMGD
jgi:uncharacterized protein (TIGR02172 family)